MSQLNQTILIDWIFFHVKLNQTNPTHLWRMVKYFKMYISLHNKYNYKKMLCKCVSLPQFLKHTHVLRHFLTRH